MHPRNYYWFSTKNGTQVVIEKGDVWSVLDSRKFTVYVMRKTSKDVTLRSIAQMYDRYPTDHSTFDMTAIEDNLIKSNGFRVFSSATPDRKHHGGLMSKEAIQNALYNIVDTLKNGVLRPASFQHKPKQSGLGRTFATTVINSVIPYLILEGRDEEALELSNAFIIEIQEENVRAQEELKAKIVKEIQTFFSILLKTHQERVDALVNVMEL